MKLKHLLTLLTALIPSAVFAHADHGSEHPWKACVDLSRGAPCQYIVSGKHLYRGTCQLMRQHLMCVRNQPIEHIE